MPSGAAEVTEARLSSLPITSSSGTARLSIDLEPLPMTTIAITGLGGVPDATWYNNRPALAIKSCYVTRDTPADLLRALFTHASRSRWANAAEVEGLLQLSDGRDGSKDADRRPRRTTHMGQVCVDFVCAPTPATVCRCPRRRPTDLTIGMVVHRATRQATPCERSRAALSWTVEKG